MNSVQLGKFGEETAVRFLRAEGYEILKRNYRGESGEIDIIATREREISFIEVKTRRNYSFGRPCEAVSRDKRRRIKDAALCYLREPCNRSMDYRRLSFDVVEVVLEHMKNVF